MSRKTQLTAIPCALAAAAVLGAVQLAAGSSAEDWPQFRGIHRNGVSAETGMLGSWPEGGPKEVWRVPIGEGYSAVSVVGNRLYTMFADNDEEKPTEFAAAFDAATGKELWRVPVGEKSITQFGNGPRSTPTVDGDSLYVLGSRGDLVALATKDGAERWRINLTEAFGSQVPYWGFSTSPLIDGKQLVIEGGGPEGKSYVALNKKTGETRWTFGDGPQSPGYNSPIAVDMGGGLRYVYVVGEKLTALDPDGKEIWSYPWPSGETHAAPLFVPPNRLFASGAEGVGGTLVEVQDNGGEASASEVWHTRFMRNHFSSSVFHDGHIFGFDNATLKCLSVDDAKLAWAKRGLGKGSLILIDGHLIVLSDLGQMLLVEATAEGFRQKGSVQALEGRSWTAPTLSGGRLYLRNHTEMVSYDIKG